MGLRNWLKTRHMTSAEREIYELRGDVYGERDALYQLMTETQKAGNAVRLIFVLGGSRTASGQQMIHVGAYSWNEFSLDAKVLIAAPIQLLHEHFEGAVEHLRLAADFSEDAARRAVVLSKHWKEHFHHKERELLYIDSFRTGDMTANLHRCISLVEESAWLLDKARRDDGSDVAEIQNKLRAVIQILGKIYLDARNIGHYEQECDRELAKERSFLQSIQAPKSDPPYRY